MAKGILRDKSFAFALQIIKLYKYLTEDKKRIYYEQASFKK
jgi:hypothetical protein